MLASLTLPLVGVVRSSDLIAVLVALLAVTLVPAWIRSAGRFDDLPLRRICVLLFLIAFLGARLSFAATHATHYWARPLDLFDPHPAGRNAPGAVLALFLLTPPVLRRFGVPAARFMDAGVPAMCVLLALSRLGCLLHGCCVGRLGDVPWCVAYPRDSALFRLETSLEWLPEDAPATHPVHLLPLYFAITAVAIAIVSTRLQRHRRFDWQVTATATLLFGVANATLEIWRLDLPTRVYWGPLPHLVWVNIALAVAGATLLVWADRTAVPDG